MTSEPPQRRRIVPIAIEAAPVVEHQEAPSVPPIPSDSLPKLQLGPTRRMRIDLKAITNDDDPFNIIDLREIKAAKKREQRKKDKENEAALAPQQNDEKEGDGQTTAAPNADGKTLKIATIPIPTNEAKKGNASGVGGGFNSVIQRLEVIYMNAGDESDSDDEGEEDEEGEEGEGEESSGGSDSDEGESSGGGSGGSEEGGDKGEGGGEPKADEAADPLNPDGAPKLKKRRLEVISYDDDFIDDAEIIKGISNSRTLIPIHHDKVFWVNQGPIELKEPEPATAPHQGPSNCVKKVSKPQPVEEAGQQDLKSSKGAASGGERGAGASKGVKRTLVATEGEGKDNRDPSALPKPKKKKQNPSSEPPKAASTTGDGGGAVGEIAQVAVQSHPSRPKQLSIAALAAQAGKKGSTARPPAALNPAPGSKAGPSSPAIGPPDASKPSSSPASGSKPKVAGRPRKAPAAKDLSTLVQAIKKKFDSISMPPPPPPPGVAPPPAPAADLPLSPPEITLAQYNKDVRPLVQKLSFELFQYHEMKQDSISSFLPSLSSSLPPGYNSDAWTYLQSFVDDAKNQLQAAKDKLKSLFTCPPPPPPPPPPPTSTDAEPPSSSSLAPSLPPPSFLSAFDKTLTAHRKLQGVGKEDILYQEVGTWGCYSHSQVQSWAEREKVKAAATKAQASNTVAPQGEEGGFTAPSAAPPTAVPSVVLTAVPPAVPPGASSSVPSAPEAAEKKKRKRSTKPKDVPPLPPPSSSGAVQATSTATGGSSVVTGEMPKKPPLSSAAAAILNDLAKSKEKDNDKGTDLSPETKPDPFTVTFPSKEVDQGQVDEAFKVAIAQGLNEGEAKKALESTLTLNSKPWLRAIYKTLLQSGGKTGLNNKEIVAEMHKCGFCTFDAQGDKVKAGAMARQLKQGALSKFVVNVGQQRFVAAAFGVQPAPPPPPPASASIPPAPAAAPFPTKASGSGSGEPGTSSSPSITPTKTGMQLLLASNPQAAAHAILASNLQLQQLLASNPQALFSRMKSLSNLNTLALKEMQHRVLAAAEGPAPAPSPGAAQPSLVPSEPAAAKDSQQAIEQGSKATDNN